MCEISYRTESGEAKAFSRDGSVAPAKSRKAAPKGGSQAPVYRMVNGGADGTRTRDVTGRRSNQLNYDSARNLKFSRSARMW